jgi:hypothetical protein
VDLGLLFMFKRKSDPLKLGFSIRTKEFFFT